MARKKREPIRGPKQQKPDPDPTQDEEQREGVTEVFPKPDEYRRVLEEHGYPEHLDAYNLAIQICEGIQEAGGEALLVGGSVRDIYFGAIPKDYDVEVYGLQAEEIEAVVEKYGKVRDVGRAFGILKVTLENGLDLDISLPRTDSKIGAGHKGFVVNSDPFMSVEEAAKRRDFTFNALAANPLTGELHDYYGGLDDIKSRTLRITDHERFADDPLRVLRAMQFIGRFGLRVHPDDLPIIQSMSELLSELPKERFAEEWKKLLLRSEKPSLGLNAGLTFGVFHAMHPEFPELVETEQEEEWHPEGNVWIHTMMVVDEAAKIIKREQLTGKAAMTIMLTAFCHDLGKPATTEVIDGRITSRGHEPAGKEPTRKFLMTIGIDNKTIAKVIQLVGEHIVPTAFYIEHELKGNKLRDGAIRRLAKRIDPATIQELVLVCEADHAGRGEFPPETVAQMQIPPDRFTPGPWILEWARRLAVEDSKPVDLTMGRDWIAFGYRPGKHFGDLIALANDLRDEQDYTKDMVFLAVDGLTDPQQAITKLKGLLGRK